MGVRNGCNGFVAVDATLVSVETPSTMEIISPSTFRYTCPSEKYMHGTVLINIDAHATHLSDGKRYNNTIRKKGTWKIDGLEWYLMCCVGMMPGNG